MLKHIVSQIDGWKAKLLKQLFSGIDHAKSSMWPIEKQLDDPTTYRNQSFVFSYAPISLQRKEIRIKVSN